MTHYSNTTAGNGDYTTQVKRLHSFTLAETSTSAGNPIWVTLRDGSVTGTQVANIRVAAMDSKTVVWPKERPLAFPSGLFIQVRSGTTGVYSLDGS